MDTRRLPVVPTLLLIMFSVGGTAQAQPLGCTYNSVKQTDNSAACEINPPTPGTIVVSVSAIVHGDVGKGGRGKPAPVRFSVLDNKMPIWNDVTVMASPGQGPIMMTLQPPIRVGADDHQLTLQISSELNVSNAAISVDFYP